MSLYKTDFESMSWDVPMPGIRHKIAERDGRRLRLVEYTAEMEPHWCERGHTGYMLEGRFEIRFENETLVFEEGDGIYLPEGSEHKHMGKVLTDRVRVFFLESS